MAPVLGGAKGRRRESLNATDRCEPVAAYGTPPLPCAESNNLRSSFPHQTRITRLNCEACMAMVMVAAILLMVLMMKMTTVAMMLSMMSKMI